MKFSKEAIEEAAKLSKMSVGDYLDKLPSSFYEEAAKQSGFSNQEYLGKLKSIYSEPLKKKKIHNLVAQLLRMVHKILPNPHQVQYYHRKTYLHRQTILDKRYLM